MQKTSFLSLFFSLVLFSGYCQTQVSETDSVNFINSPVSKPEVYKIKKVIDLPLTAAMCAWSLYGMNVIYNRDPIPVAEILALNRNSINALDRPIADNRDEKAKSLSDKFFYGSMPLPFILMADKKIRKDGFKVGLLYLEAMSATGVLYTTSAMIANRYRPYTYNPNVDMETRTRGGARNSFFAGHPSVAATSVFFVAKIYCDYHPQLKRKWILYALAGSIAATTGILRIKAGEHFITDVSVGVPVGVLSGLLIPSIHKNKDFKNTRFTFLPNFQRQSSGVTVFYKINKQ